VGKLKKGEMRIQHLANLNTVFKFLQNYVKLVDIGPQVRGALVSGPTRLSTQLINLLECPPPAPQGRP
jgi:hypothetical protein